MHVHLGEHFAGTDPCSVVLVEERPLLAAALASSLESGHVRVDGICDQGAAMVETSLQHRPHVLVLSNGLTRAGRRLLPVLRDAVPSVATLVVIDAHDRVLEAEDCPSIDAVLGPDVGVDHLVRAVLRACAGESFVEGVVRSRSLRAARRVELTEREEQVLHRLAAGASNMTIARDLDISVNTVRTHVQSIFRKLGEGRRLAAVRRADELGLLDGLSA